jgi:Icc-related predicted phosphoesterase
MWQRMRLLAISDLHLGHAINRKFFSTIGSSRDDWLILAGDDGELERKALKPSCAVADP